MRRGARANAARLLIFFMSVHILDAPMQVSSLEQSMACGEDAVGRTYKNALADLKGFLASSDGQLLSPGDARAHAPSQWPIPGDRPEISAGSRRGGADGMTHSFGSSPSDL